MGNFFLEAEGRLRSVSYWNNCHPQLSPSAQQRALSLELGQENMSLCSTAHSTSFEAAGYQVPCMVLCWGLSWGAREKKKITAALGLRQPWAERWGRQLREVTASLQQQNLPVTVSQLGSECLPELLVCGQGPGPPLQATAPLPQQVLVVSEVMVPSKGWCPARICRSSPCFLPKAEYCSLALGRSVMKSIESKNC